MKRLLVAMLLSGLAGLCAPAAGEGAPPAAGRSFLRQDPGASDTGPASAGWRVVDVAGDHPRGGVSLALTSSGRPRIAYVNGEDRLKVALCDGACTDPAAWTVVELGAVDTRPEYILPVDLVVGPDDRAHILYGISGAYTACSGDCSDPAAWSAPVHLTYDDGAVAIPATALALNGEGHPRTSHLGTAWGACDGACEEAGSWVYAPTGRERIWFVPVHDSLAVHRPPSGPERLGILGQWFWASGGGIDAYTISTCGGGCADPAGWTHGGESLDPLSGEYVTALKADSQGAPHFLISSRTGQGSSAAYGPYGVTFEDRSALALALSPADAPRVAMLNASGGLDLASCDAGCDAPGSWTFRPVAAEVSAAPLNCPAYLDMALDPSGRALFAYKYEGLLRFAAPADAPPPWGAAPAGPGAGPSGAMNSLLLLLTPLGASLLLRVRRKRGALV